MDPRVCAASLPRLAPPVDDEASGASSENPSSGFGMALDVSGKWNKYFTS
jgi:hypothetical protein